MLTHIGCSSTLQGAPGVSPPLSPRSEEAPLKPDSRQTEEGTDDGAVGGGDGEETKRGGLGGGGGKGQQGTEEEDDEEIDIDGIDVQVSALPCQKLHLLL